MLDDFGYAVRGVRSGKMAFFVMAASPPDLILLDINMPEMDGFEVCRRLKADETTQAIPIVFLSALDQPIDKVQAFSVGGIDYITKPFQETRDLGLLDETEIVARAAQYDGISHEVGLHCGNFERILETADLARLGDEGRAELLNRLDDPDSAVRFWAVTGLCSLGVESAMIERLTPLLDDPSISVCLAAGDYLVRAGEGALALPAFARALAGDILWARIRAGAYLSYRSREELRPMTPLVTALQAAMDSQKLFGPEHDPHIRTNQFAGMLNAQRDVIGKRWVLERVAKRIELSLGQES